MGSQSNIGYDMVNIFVIDVSGPYPMLQILLNENDFLTRNQLLMPNFISSKWIVLVVTPRAGNIMNGSTHTGGTF